MKEQDEPEPTLELHNLYGLHVVIEINRDDDIDTYIKNFATILASVGFSSDLIREHLELE